MITHVPVWGQQPNAYRHGDSTLRTVPLRVLPPERSVGGGGVEGELLESRGVGGRLMRLGVVQWWVLVGVVVVCLCRGCHPLSTPALFAVAGPLYASRLAAQYTI